MKPKGTLLIIGGGEDKAEIIDNVDPKSEKLIADINELEILKEIIPENRKKGIIELITTATTIPKEAAKRYKYLFKKLGFTNLRIMDVENRAQCMDEKNIQKIKEASAVFFTGGDQFRISTIIGGTPLVAAIEEKYHKDDEFTLAGTSAGAMVMAKTMLYAGKNNEAMLKDDVKIAGGLGFLDNCIVDTHFVKRGRFTRLTQAIITNPSCIGIGIGEDTALKITEGNHMECIGTGMVIIIDGQHIKDTNIAVAKEYTPLWVENIIVHIMAKGTGFLFKERKFLPCLK